MTEIVAKLGELLRSRGWMLATAESCTGGLIGHTLTGVSGSSDWYVGGVIAYANEVKSNILGVPAEVLNTVGAVSEETVRAMAEGAQRAFGAEVSVAVSGIAGPTGGTPDKPVGTVWIAWGTPDGVTAKRFLFGGGRENVKLSTARAAIEGLIELTGG